MRYHEKQILSYLGLCLGLKHSQHFLANQCTYKGVSLLKEVFPVKKKKNSAFLVLQVSGTLKYRVSYNLELRVVTVSFV